jgi:oligopeptide transport system ATP-binding protein
MPENNVILRVDKLKMYFPIKAGVFQRHIGDIKAVDGINFEIVTGETLGLVGESGCGKTTTGRAIIRLYKPTGGHVFFEGQDMAELKGETLRKMRRKMQMIFQDPYASLNPRMSVSGIISEPLTVHHVVSGQEKKDKVAELMELVGLNPGLMNRYPHEFSGGQRQRIGLARSLALQPDLIICDEPISALDVSIQAQVVNLLEELQEKFGLTYLFIAHDLSMVRHISDRTAVMYLGKVVEMSPQEELYNHPLHPYTQALLSAVPIPDPVVERKRQRIILTGDVPSPAHPPLGCNFNPRCPLAQQVCQEEEPEWREASPNHWVACHLV